MAQASAVSFDSHVKGGDRDHSPPPAGEELRELERRWASCKTDADRKAVALDAKATVQAFKDRKPRAMPRTAEWEQEIADDDRPSREVARVYGISHMQVIRYRRKWRRRA